MSITYDTIKNLPCEQLHNLFMAVEWSDGTETTFMIDNFNKPFVNSTIVISAWENDCLVGCVRVLSDKIFRSIIYDLAVKPEYQNRGIGKELVRKCKEYFPNSEWLVETFAMRAGFYEKLGFKTKAGVSLSIPSKWF